MADTPSLAVWAADNRSGLLARGPRKECVFAYSPDAGADAQVSLTMPVRLESWVSRDLHPVFQMNLPEGALLEAIRRAIAKVVGRMTFPSSASQGETRWEGTGFRSPATSRRTLRRHRSPSTNCSPIRHEGTLP
jgi:HipA-like protein